MIKGLVAIAKDDLKKVDCRAFSTLYLYWLENGKKNVFDLPLFVDDNGKGVMSVESFKRVFFAFCSKIGAAYSCDIKNGNDGNDASYNVVRLSKTELKIDSVEFLANFEAPKKTEVKRESSKKTSEKAKAKKEQKEKEQKEKEIESNKEWNNKACTKLVDLFQSYGVRLDNEKMSKLEKDIIKILETI